MRFNKLKNVVGLNSLLLILLAAVLLEVTGVVQYHYVRNRIIEDLEIRAHHELQAKSFAIRHHLSTAETAVNNHLWDARRLIGNPDSMFFVAQRLVSQNPDVVGSSISFVPDYYREKGRWFEPYAVRRGDIVDTMQLGSASHDYTQMEFFTAPLEKKAPHWSNPYLDSDGAQMRLTTYSSPILDERGRPVAIMDVDLSLNGIDSVLDVSYLFPSSYNILISRSGELMDYPDSSREMHSTLREAVASWRDPAMHEVADRMIAGEAGKAVIEDNDGNRSRIFYAPVGGGADWSLAVVCSEKDIFASLEEMHNKLVWLQIVGVVFLIFIIVRAILNLNRLQKVSAAKQKIDSELGIAREIQLGMLPRAGGDSFLGGRLKVAGSLVAAKEVGGDLYDYYVKDGKLFFCIGDVSGKGVPAALLMAMARSMFRTVSASGSSPAKILSTINGYVLDSDRSNMFITMFIGVLHLETGYLSYCNAGHDAPILISGGKVEKLPVMSNLPVGVMEDFEYEGQHINLPRRATIFLYTDGLTEAMDSAHNQFGEARLLDAIGRINETGEKYAPEKVIKNISNDVEKFVGGAEQSDDLTMLAIRYDGADKSDRKSRMLKLENNISQIPVLNRFVEEEALQAGCGPDGASELKLAAEEAVVNIINYAYPFGTSGSIWVEAEKTREGITLRITDEGEEFDPTKADDVDISLDVDERGIGGLGIHLVKQLTDSLEYFRADGRNILILKKNSKS